MISVNGKKVYEHRYVMEQHLGRKLLKGEEVHHIKPITPQNITDPNITLNQLDNRIENLEVLSIEEHKKHHRNPINGQFTSRVTEKEE